MGAQDSTMNEHDRRRKIREKLLQNKGVKISNQGGEVEPAKETEDTLNTPPGILA
jgi:methylmalonyl-CoA mutase cobalamin-binding subunit